MTARLLIRIPRQHAGAHAAEVWAFYRDDRGVYCLSEIDPSRFSPSEREEFDLKIAQDAAFAAYMEECCYRDAPEEDDNPRFPTLTLARRYAALADEEDSIASEMQAFGAPSECAELAYSSLESRRNELLGWAAL